MASMRHQHARIMEPESDDLLDGPRSPIGNGDYVNLYDLQSHGKYEFVLLNNLEPPASLAK